MPNVYLPCEHTDADLALAGQLADLLESDSLYVTWAGSRYEEPQVQALVRVEEAPAERTVPEHGLLTEIVGTMVAFVAALFGPRPAPARRSAA